MAQQNFIVPSLPTWPRFRMTSTCQILATQFRIFELLELLFVVLATEKTKPAWESLLGKLGWTGEWPGLALIDCCLEGCWRNYAFMRTLFPKL